jgi:hypothetical protein
MWNFIAQPGIASASVDFTSEFSLLALGLLGLLALSAGLIAFAATRQHMPQKTEIVAELEPVPADHRDAA